MQLKSARERKIIIIYLFLFASVLFVFLIFHVITNVEPADLAPGARFAAGPDVISIDCGLRKVVEGDTLAQRCATDRNFIKNPRIYGLSDHQENWVKFQKDAVLLNCTNRFYCLVEDVVTNRFQ